MQKIALGLLNCQDKRVLKKYMGPPEAKRSTTTAALWKESQG
jgi:hypothetical protein